MRTSNSTIAILQTASRAAPKVLECLRKLLGGDKDNATVSDKSRMKALKQREMVQEVSTLFSAGRKSKLGIFKRAAHAMVAKRNKRKGIQTLRKLSITTLNSTVAALQGQHVEISSAVPTNVNRKQPSFYELPAASLAAKVYSKQVEKTIGAEAKAIRRTLRVQAAREKWTKQQANASAKQLLKTATAHNLLSSRPGTSNSPLSTTLPRSASSRIVKFADREGLSEQPRYAVPDVRGELRSWLT